MFENYPLLTTVIIDKYPYILVDEYQDTATETIQTLIDIILTNNEKSILLGFFGDSHQKIYEGGIGSLKAYVDKNVLIGIKKEENFRSSSVIVSLLNHVRTNIQQQSQTNILNSTIKFFFYTNPPKEVRKDEKGKNKKEGVREYNKRIQPLKDDKYNSLLNRLIQDGWDLKEGGVDKILILTNSRVAGRAGFGELYKVFSERYGTNAKQRLLDRTHPIIQFFVGSFDKKSSLERLTGVEHLCQFWKYKDYANVISFIKKYGKSDLVYLHSHEDKEKISNCLDSLIQETQTKSIKEVMEFILKEGLLKRSDRISDILSILNIDLSLLEDGEEKEKLIRNKKFLEDFLALPYKQIVAFFQHIQNHTVFSTKHGTKGEEYRNVLVILDDTEWISEYSFNCFFDKSDKESHSKRYQMTKNLFYVSCSRAKEKLVVLMLSPLKEVSLNIIKDWFGEGNVKDIEKFLKE